MRHLIRSEISSHSLLERVMGLQLFLYHGFSYTPSPQQSSSKTIWSLWCKLSGLDSLNHLGLGPTGQSCWRLTLTWMVGCRSILPSHLFCCHLRAIHPSTFCFQVLTAWHDHQIIMRRHPLSPSWSPLPPRSSSPSRFSDHGFHCCISPCTRYASYLFIHFQFQFRCFSSYFLNFVCYLSDLSNSCSGCAC